MVLEVSRHEVLRQKLVYPGASLVAGETTICCWIGLRWSSVWAELAEQSTISLDLTRPV
jgi:hypothetical protein